MATLAGPTSRNQLTRGLVKADQLDAVGGTVLGTEGRAIEADAGLDADQVGPEAGSERPLHEEHVGPVECGRGYLSVGSLVDASRIDDFTYERISATVHRLL